jgi:hypothetical protein
VTPVGNPLILEGS